VGKLLSVGKSTVHRWLSTNPLLERRARQQRVSNTILAAIHAFVLKRPFALRKDVIESVRDTFSLKLSASSISRALHSLGLRRKRTSYVPYIDRAVAEKRQAFGVKLADTPMAQTVCIDETAFQFDMFPSYGYAPSGCRLLAPRRHKAYCRRFSVIAAVTSSEVLAYKIIQGSIDSSAFSGFVTALPVGEDHRSAMCDNVAFHKTVKSRAAFQSTGLEPLYQSPYSPDFNPIELVFGRLKSAYRQLSDGIPFEIRLRTAFNAITSTALFGMFAHCWKVAAAEAKV
jgi:putative transposase